jgi:adenylosuccinate lyase
MEDVASGLEVHPARIRARIAEELPFMATEVLLMRAVQAGGDRQAVHEVIRGHSIAAARAMKDEGRRNDLLDRLAADAAFPLKGDALETALDASRFVGRAPEQVDEFLAEVVEPILVAAGESGPAREEIRV